MVDYRKILVLYIEYVGLCEGSDFLASIDEIGFPEMSTEEREALRIARDEAREPHKAYPKE